MKDDDKDWAVMIGNERWYKKWMDMIGNERWWWEMEVMKEMTGNITVKLNKRKLNFDLLVSGYLTSVNIAGVPWTKW